jgi:hypothetical protein
MTRWLLPFALLLVVPVPARATPSLAADSVGIQIGNLNDTGTDIDLISTTDKPKMFNLANCECGTPRTVKVTISGASSFDGTTNVYYYLGANCSDTTSRQTCRQVAVHKLSEYYNQSVFEDVTAAEVISPSSPTCYPESSAKSGANTFFVFIDWNGDQAFDEDNDTIQSLELDYDVEPPDVVRNIVVTPGEEALNVSWSVPSDTDLQAIQVLCARGTLPVFPAGTYDPAYDSAAGVCPSGGDGGVADGGTSDGGASDGGVGPQSDAGTGLQQDAAADSDAGVVTGIPIGTGLASLDPAYLCSHSLGAGTSNTRIATLQDGVTYYVIVVAVDKAGNASAVTAMVPGTPEEVLDFWEDYKQQGGGATGCSLAQRFPVGWLGLALAGIALVLVLGSRRRRGGR